MKRVFALNAGLERYGPTGRQHCLTDMAYHLSYLSEALASNRSEIFEHYVTWAKLMLDARGIPMADLVLNLEALDFVLNPSTPRAVSEVVRSYVKAAIEAVTRSGAEETGKSLDPPRNPQLFRSYLDALLRQDRTQAVRVVLEAADSGVALRDLYLDILQPAQHEIGRLWQVNQISVAQEHYCSAVTQLIMAQLYPRILERRRREEDRKVVVSAIQDDLHEIGARMVADFFDMAGWTAMYLGANTPIGELLAIMRQERRALLALSVTISHHIGNLRQLIDAIRAEPACANAPILVGGYAFNAVPELWRMLGANGYAPNAEEAVVTGEKILRELHGEL